MTDTMTSTRRETELLRPWSIEWRSGSHLGLSSSEVTVGQFSLAVLLASDSFDLDPRRSPSNLVAWVIVAVISETGRDVADVQ